VRISWDCVGTLKPVGASRCHVIIWSRVDRDARIVYQFVEGAMRTDLPERAITFLGQIVEDAECSL